MTERKLLFTQVIVLVVIFGLVIFGMSHDYLWGVAWYSAIAHFLGGSWVALFAAWGQSMLRLPRNFIMYAGAALVVGIFWEIFEVSIGATHFPADMIDTMADLCMDVIGGAVTASALRYIWLRR